MPTKLSAARLARLAVESLPDGPRITFTAPKFLRPDRVGDDVQVSWSAEMALAVAGHICQHWGMGVSTRPLVIESARRSVITLRYEAWHGTYRLAAYFDESRPHIIERCGHSGCQWAAPRPGARCDEHFTDEVQEHQASTHWAEVAAEEWRRKHPTSGEDKTMLDNERNGLIKAAIGVGMKPMELHRRTGIARSTIDRILSPEVMTVEGDDPEGAA
ncbi:hypothetical protein [Streptomyces niveus]|uniref:hypothetical protein n=1 Tax=Streptomyces niveus TaxID=193462 RepID=UPI003424D94D